MTLLAYYKMDEGSGVVTKDSSGYGNNGSLVGCTWESGKFGKSIKFNGSSDYINCGDAASLSPTSGLSVATWIKMSSIKDCFIANRYEYLQFWYLLGNVLFDLCKGSGDWVSLGYNWTPTLDRWYHIVGTWDGTTNPNSMKIYIDGLKVTEGNFSGSIYSVPPTDFFIGYWAGGTYFLDGGIDEFRVYSTALSADEVLTLYHYNPNIRKPPFKLKAKK